MNDYGFENPGGNSVIVGQSATGTATVFGSEYGVPPSGTVILYDNNVALTDPVTYTTSANPPVLSALNATTQHVFTTAGTHQITVSYSGDTNYTPATSPIPQSLNVVGPISVSAAPIANLAPGQSGSSTVTVTPNGEFTGAVNLTCSVSTSISNPVDPPTCSIPASVTLSGTSAATTTLTVNTTASTTGALVFPLRKSLVGGGAVTLAMIFLFGIRSRRRAWWGQLSLLAVIFIVGAIGCGGSGGSGGGGGGGGGSGTSAGNYTVTVTGTDAATGKITASTTVSLTVN
jgi:trimeric autotransporter adhesin